ncbi:hypothetical protein [Pseudomonas sp. Pseusp97]|uniref:hypothetical protein n=1 Tax=Pseudomonas sp. Pseusp97 TaxID=3243065 RepID=UPI0039A780B0
MILRFFKPSWRKLLIAVGLYYMTAFLTGVNSAIRDHMRDDFAETVVGQKYATEIKRIYKEYHCEAQEKIYELTRSMVDEPRSQGLNDQLDRKMAVFAWAKSLLIALLSYFAACIACTVGAHRGTERA